MSTLRVERTDGSSWPVLVIAGLALVLRLGVIAAVGFNPAFFDVDGYHSLALVGLSGAPVPSDIHPPGYGWFLLAVYWLFGPRPRVVYLFQALAAALTVGLVGDAARRRWGGRAGWMAAALLAVDGYQTVASSALAGETVAMLGVAVVAWLLLPRAPVVPNWALATAGAVIGALALVRTGFLLLLVVPVGLVLVRTPRALSRLIAAAGLVVMGAVPLVGYAAWRAERTGAFRLGSPWDVTNLWLGNNPNATGRIDPMPGLPALGIPGVTDEEARARLLGPQAVRFAVTHPLREAELVACRASYLFAPAKRDVLYIYGNGWAGERPAWLVWAIYVWVALAVPCLVLPALFVLVRGREDAAWWLGLALVLLGALPYLVSIGDARFLLPFHPVWAFMAAALMAPGVASKERRWRWWLGALLIVAFLANAVYDLALTQPAIRALAAPGGSALKPPYHFAR